MILRFECAVNLGEIKDQAKLIYNFFNENEKVLMLVLDACNWRVLSSLKNEWDLEVVRSRGSWTLEWLQRTFLTPLKDVIYISANPYTYLLKRFKSKFKKVINLPLLVWNFKFNTVHPRSVNFFVREQVKFGEKKIIAHYMQPHPPFIFKTWLNIFSHDFRNGKRELKIYDLARKSFDVRKEFIKAYTKNLCKALKYVESIIKIVRNFDSNFKIVITSDHSEVLRGVYYPFKFRKKFWLWLPWVLGIYRFVGHETSSRLSELYEVPWIVF